MLVAEDARCDCCEPDPRECDQCGGDLPGMSSGLCPTCQREAMGENDEY